MRHAQTYLGPNNIQGNCIEVALAVLELVVVRQLVLSVEFWGRLRT